MEFAPWALGLVPLPRFHAAERRGAERKALYHGAPLRGRWSWFHCRNATQRSYVVRGLSIRDNHATNESVQEESVC